MRISTFVSMVAGVLILAACSDSTGADPMRLAELAQQESEWQDQNIHSYSFEYHHQFAGAIEAAEITVVADTVAAAVDLEADTLLSLDPSFAWPTVAALFASAREALSSPDVNVTIEYEPTLNYPTRIDVSPVIATPAGGSTTSATNLHAVEPLGGE
ncbi:MAG TPA: DUF6174 domain-containing protein [Gemmatimonadaceae bacterium]|nr:DUF6174 domain-containing protein [Gemmatimonadaceae bacterium]